MRVNQELRELRKYKPSDMFPPSEVLEIVSICDHPRDAAMVAVQHDDALRPHELLSLRNSSIALYDNYAQLTVPPECKTGSRTLPITYSYSYLRDWMKVHPMKDQPEAFLFPRIRHIANLELSKYHYKPAMGYHNYWDMLRKYKKKLNHKLNRPYWNPYIFRHSRLTEYANILTDQQLKTFAGWTPDSPMPAIYIHLSGKDLNPTILAYHGIIKKEEEKPIQIIQKKCPRCEYINQPTNRYCDKCSLALTLEAWSEIKNKESETQTDLAFLKCLVKQLAEKADIKIEDPDGNLLSLT